MRDGTVRLESLRKARAARGGILENPLNGNSILKFFGFKLFGGRKLVSFRLTNTGDRRKDTR